MSKFNKVLSFVVVFICCITTSFASVACKEKYDS